MGPKKNNREANRKIYAADRKSKRCFHDETLSTTRVKSNHAHEYNCIMKNIISKTGPKSLS